MYYVTEEDIISHKRKHDLKACYNGVQTVLGTCSYHFFIPDGDSPIMKRISVDTMMFNNLMTQTTLLPINQASTVHATMSRFGTLE